MTELGEFLDPAVVAEIERLEVVARGLVEGFLRGVHLSREKGSSTEFAEHRPYVAGDDIRRVDWRTYARTDRYHLKEYDNETNLRATLVIDTSASMDFGSTALTKHRYALSLAAALGYLLLRQRDGVGLALGADRIERWIPARATAEHLAGVYRAMEASRPRGATGLSALLGAVAARQRGRGLTAVVSDFLDDPGRILSGLASLRHPDREVLAFHLVDPAEASLPFDTWMVFRDPEQPSTMLRLDARRVRASYLESFDRHRAELRRGCASAGVEYCEIRTDESFDRALARFLEIRARRA